MLTIFFTIVFIAEIIITVWVIKLICKIDSDIQRLNCRVLVLNPIIENVFCKTRISINSVLLGVNKLEQTLVLKKEKFIENITDNTFSTVLLILTRISGCKIFSFIELFKTFYKLMKK